MILKMRCDTVDGAAKKRKNEMILRIMLSVIVVCLLAGGGYWYWTTTPQYSMKELSQSVKTHDPASFHQYVDVPSVANHAVDDLLSDQVRESGGSGLLERFLGNAIIGVFKPEIVQLLSNSINNYVAKPAAVSAPAPPPQEAGNGEELSLTQQLKQTLGRVIKRVGQALKPPSLKDVLSELGITKENYRGLTGFETKDELCHVGLRFQPPDKAEIVVELELQKVESHWQVKRISNLDNLAKSLAGI